MKLNTKGVAGASVPAGDEPALLQATFTGSKLKVKEEPAEGPAKGAGTLPSVRSLGACCRFARLATSNGVPLPPLPPRCRASVATGAVGATKGAAGAPA